MQKHELWHAKFRDKTLTKFSAVAVNSPSTHEFSSDSSQFQSLFSTKKIALLKLKRDRYLYTFKDGADILKV